MPRKLELPERILRIGRLGGFDGPIDPEVLLRASKRLNTPFGSIRAYYYRTRNPRPFWLDFLTLKEKELGLRK